MAFSLLSAFSVCVLSLGCVLLIHFIACEWKMINMFVLTLNAVCVCVCVRPSPMGTAMCAKACVIRNTHTQKKTEIESPPIFKRSHTPYLPPPQTIVLHMSLSETVEQSHFP